VSTTESVVKTAGAIQAVMELTINAPRQRVWEAFLNEPHEWWHKDFFTAKGPATFRIDSKIGGYMYEDAGDGAGMIWFTILGIWPGEMLFTIGHTAPPYGGPATGLVTFAFEEVDENTTKFKVTDDSFGHVSEDMVASAEGGWKMLFTELKTHVEK
jgi:uncharacterized protein YndB with AHSA1/START domain